MKWLLLVHQVQSPKSRERVRVWRLVRKAGAVLYRNSVYVVPYSRDNLEHLQWICQQIADSRGEASFFVTEPGDKNEDLTLKHIYDTARELEYRKVEKMVQSIWKRMKRLDPAKESYEDDRAGMAKVIGKADALFKEIAATDFFSVPLGARVRERIDRLRKENIKLQGSKVHKTMKAHNRSAFRNRRWATREHIHIDRLCSAWLIKHFIDPGARFVFAPEKSLPAEAIPFDVLGAEFSHHGDDCTFETLLKAFHIKDDALDSMAEIVHDIDIRDGKFGRPEAAGLDLVIRSLSGSLNDDHKVLAAGSVVLDALYHRFSRNQESQ